LLIVIFVVRKSSSENAIIVTEHQRELKKTIEERWENSRKMIADAARGAEKHHLVTQGKLDVSQKAVTNIEAVVTDSKLQIQKTHSIVEQVSEQTRK